MKRRHFMGASASVAVGYQVFKTAEDQLEYNHPEIVHNHSKEPVRVIPTSDGIQLIDGNNTQSALRITANKYGDPSSVYSEYRLSADSDNHTIQPPETDNLFAYTVYSESDGYLGESNPLRIESGRVVEVISEIPHIEGSDYPLEREPKRGYFEIEFGSEDISFPISYQRYLMSNRIIGYGQAYEYASSSKFLEETGKRILSQSDSETQYEKIRTLVKPVQRMNWESDMNSIGKYEYIRDPARTFVEMTGDCKDRTVINNGLLEGALNLETCAVFVTGHMLTGLSYSSLNDQSKNNLGDVERYEGENNSYIAVDSTSARDIGFKIPRPVYALYKDHYQIYNLAGLADHISYVLPKLMLFRSFG